MGYIVQREIDPPGPLRLLERSLGIPAETYPAGFPIQGDLDDSEEGEFLSDDKEGEVEVPEHSVHIFKAGDYQYLLSKTMAMLDL